MRIDWT